VIQKSCDVITAPPGAVQHSPKPTHADDATYENLERLKDLRVLVRVVHLSGHEGDELGEVNLPIAVRIHLVDHLLELRVGGVLTHPLHNDPQLRRGDGAIPILVLHPSSVQGKLNTRMTRCRAHDRMYARSEQSDKPWLAAAKGALSDAMTTHRRYGSHMVGIMTVPSSPPTQCPATLLRLSSSTSSHTRPPPARSTANHILLHADMSH